MSDDTDPSRLERRLARERAARTEAEAIAERTLRDLYLSNRNLHLLGKVADISNRSTSIEDALRDALPILVELGPWDSGQAFLLESAGAAGEPFLELVRGHGSFAPGPAPGQFSSTRGLVEPADLASLALIEPIWVSDLAKQNYNVDGVPLVEGAACAFAIVANGAAVGALVLFALAPAKPDSGFAERAILLSRQLGQVVEREIRLAQKEKEQQRLAQEVEKRTEDLLRARSHNQQSAHARESLQATLSHELLTPLHAVIAATEQAKSSQPENLGEFCDIVQVSSEKLRGQIMRLLELLAYKAQEADPVSAALLPTLLPSIDEFTEILHTQDRRIEIHTSAVAKSEFIFDRSALTAAFEASMSLVITNTIGTVKISLTVTGGNISISISGADRSEHASTAKIVEQIAAAAGGSATEKIKDSRYVVTSRIPTASATVQRHGTGRRVLLVDDTEVARHLGRGILKSLGYEVDTASDGLAAIEKMSEGNYAVILMDIGMPGLDGFEATRAIRLGQAGRVAADTPIVALTALTSATDRLRSYLAGMDDFISKPFTRDEIESIVTRFIIAEEISG